MRTPLKMPPAEGVEAGGTATIRLTGPRCYHHLAIVSNIAYENIGAIRVVANNRTVQEYTGDALNAFLSFDALQKNTDVHIFIPFDQVGLKVRGHEELTAFNVGSMDTKTGAILSDLEVQIDISADAVSPKISHIEAMVSPVKAGGPGAIRSIYRLPGTSGVAGRYDFDKLPKKTRGSQFLSRLFIKSSKITYLELQRDLRTNYERSAIVNTRLQKDSERVPQDGWFIVDFTENGYGENRLDCRSVNDLRLKLEASGAETVEVFAEYIGELEL